MSPEISCRTPGAMNYYSANKVNRMHAAAIALKHGQVKIDGEVKDGQARLLCCDKVFFFCFVFLKTCSNLVSWIDSDSLNINKVKTLS